MTKQLLIDVKKCTECRTCELKCSFVHFAVYNPNKSGVRIVSKWPELPRGRVCIQCVDPACLPVCPNETLQLSERGVVTVRYEQCISCGACVDACPFDGVWLDPLSNVAVKCDTCGGQFRCVADCFAGALNVSEA
jgi:carbon-monoxide dehydrogenase iron sulfur subunit